MKQRNNIETREQGLRPINEAFAKLFGGVAPRKAPSKPIKKKTS